MESFDIEDEKRYVRAFVGIPLPGRFKRELADLLTDLAKLDPDLRPVDADSAHVLLYFLGNQTGETLKVVAAEMSEIVPHFLGVQIAVGGAGHFRNSRREVVFLRVTGLAGAAKEIGQVVTPHLTAARKEGAGEIKSVVAERLDQVAWDFPVEELAIYGGETGKQGMAQRILIRFPVKND